MRSDQASVFGFPNPMPGLVAYGMGVRTFFAEFTWALPLLHVGAIGMLILTRWWSFRTG
ncbi:putative membrane protein [Streptomyces sp. B4I13]|nr:putative membrane protein [Streptomyces sp. B4I13]